MILGIGTDLVDIERIKKNPDVLAKRILSLKEKALYENFNNDNRKIEFLAGRFAAKEAFSKALGTGIGKISFKDIEILNDILGKPYINLNQFNNITHISITHTDKYASAFVIIEEKRG